jgi:hypothetical protein
MAGTTPNVDRTAHLLALMKKGDDAFNAREFAGMKAVHHPELVAHMGGPQAIRGQPAHAEAMKAMDEGYVRDIPQLPRRRRPLPDPVR